MTDRYAILVSRQGSVFLCGTPKGSLYTSQQSAQRDADGLAAHFDDATVIVTAVHRHDAKGSIHWAPGPRVHGALATIRQEA